MAEETKEVRQISMEIKKETSLVAREIGGISEIASKNASGTENISAAAQQQTASMEEVAASSESLADQAEQLKGLIGKFRY
ncbi:MAG: hypothetical protein LRY71_08145 [Bacillaceae bacterium]|nr:hypothetical protein [Bacillaceae bacterium]